MRTHTRVGRRQGGRFLGVFGAATTLLLMGCIAETGPAPAPEVSRQVQEEATVLNTFITDFLEIDQVGAESPDDANLFIGADPADGILAASVKKPGPGTGDYIDWDDLGGDLANHQVLDEDLSSGKDPSAFPRANECVGTANVLSKMDLRYIAAANNNQFGYFAVARNNNNGDAGYYWLFTRKPPKMVAGGGPCKSTEKQLLYDISGPDPNTGATGDVLLAGHFKPNSGPLLVVYQATASVDNVDAVSAIDFTSGLWAAHPAGVAAVAVNTTETAPGAFGAVGIGALTSGGNLEEEIFAEAAVPISIFTGGSACGATFWASVISRSSGSGGVTPDLKDLVGPTVINFGSVEAQAMLTPTCTYDTTFSASATGPDGQPLVGAVCSWFFDTGEQVTNDCASASIALSAGTRSATVIVSDPISECEDTVAAAPVAVYPPVGVTAACTPTCNLTFDYGATPSGGAGNFTYAWTFSGPGTVSPTSSEAISGAVAVGTGAVEYRADVTLTDTRGDLECPATDFCTTTPYAPLAVSLSLYEEPETCPDLATDQVTYTAVPGGGTGSYSYAWTGVSCSGISCDVSADGALCDEQSFHVTLSDTSGGLCPAVDSETETYNKVTIINASDN